MNHPTLRRLRPFACALALVVALAQPVLVSTPAHAASVPTVADGGRLKILREAWNRFGPVIITVVWEVLTDWMTGDPPPPQPIESPPQDPDFDP